MKKSEAALACAKEWRSFWVDAYYSHVPSNALVTLEINEVQIRAWSHMIDFMVDKLLMYPPKIIVTKNNNVLLVGLIYSIKTEVISKSTTYRAGLKDSTFARFP
jgi:hypothetical protein